MSVHYWRNGEPTAAAIEAFTEGDCWILAMHLSELTGWPVYTVDGDQHWVVRVPGEDRYLDITGVYTRSRLLRRWGASSLRRASGSLMDYAIRDAVDHALETFERSHQRAPIMAKLLLEKYGVEA